MGDFKKTATKVVKGVGKTSAKAAKGTAKIVKGAGKTGYKVATKSKNAVVNAIDQNGDGHIDSSDIIIMALKVPGVKINREKFLKRELNRYCTKEQINLAIATTPSTAQINPALINKIADEVIKFERNAVSVFDIELPIEEALQKLAAYYLKFED